MVRLKQQVQKSVLLFSVSILLGALFESKSWGFKFTSFYDIFSACCLVNIFNVSPRNLAWGAH